MGQSFNSGRVSADVTGKVNAIAGGVYTLTNDTITTTSSATNVTAYANMTNVYEKTILNFNSTSGKIRVRIILNAVSGGNTVEGQVYKNGFAIGTLRSITTAGVSVTTTFDEDLDFETGDKIQIYCRKVAGGGPHNLALGSGILGKLETEAPGLELI